jgi:serine phosphatase RsbU (regulator of sigma subunit)
MEWDTNSWDETTMMALSELMRNVRGNTSSGPLPQSGSSPAAAASLAGKGSRDGRAEDARFPADELAALRRDHERLQQAIFEAAQIQRKLCAPRAHEWNDFEIAGEIFPVRHLSGDFFKVTEVGSALVATLGDIAGKGLSAGIWQAHLMGLIQRSARQHAEPGRIVAEVNQELCQEESVAPLTALFVARIDPQTSELAYCNAGLPSPVVLRGEKGVEFLKEGGPMLGAVRNAAFETGRIMLQPGDMLVACSDGVTESRNKQDEEFEVERLMASAQAVSRFGATKALFSLLATVLDFADSCALHDDLTLLVIRRRATVNSEQDRSRTKKFSASARRLPRARKQKREAEGDPVPKR